MSLLLSLFFVPDNQPKVTETVLKPSSLKDDYNYDSTVKIFFYYTLALSDRFKSLEHLPSTIVTLRNAALLKMTF
jgi:hypothetical protein